MRQNGARLSKGPPSPAGRARRLDILRELWATDRPLGVIGERLGIRPGTVATLARKAGLPARRLRPISLDMKIPPDRLLPMT